MLVTSESRQAHPYPHPDPYPDPTLIL